MLSRGGSQSGPGELQARAPSTRDYYHPPDGARASLPADRVLKSSCDSSFQQESFFCATILRLDFWGGPFKTLINLPSPCLPLPSFDNLSRPHRVLSAKKGEGLSCHVSRIIRPYQFLKLFFKKKASFGTTQSVVQFHFDPRR